MAAASLKPKHVEGLVERWQAEGLAVGTIKNRMAELRWWAEKIGKQNVIARDNDHYGIGNRQYVTNVSKARQLTSGELARITDPYTAMSLRLQAAFGLRRGESIKIRPEWADRGDRLALKDTWTKGGRPREIPIRNAEQRQVLDEAKALAGRGSLIPAERSYVEQLRRFEYQCAAAGAHRIHGHRHQYAQTRYRELTGWPAPAAGGPRSRDLTPDREGAGARARADHGGVSRPVSPRPTVRATGRRTERRGASAVGGDASTAGPRPGRPRASGGRGRGGTCGRHAPAEARRQEPTISAPRSRRTGRAIAQAVPAHGGTPSRAEPPSTDRGCRSPSFWRTSTRFCSASCRLCVRRPRVSAARRSPPADPSRAARTGTARVPAPPSRTGGWLRGRHQALALVEAVSRTLTPAAPADGAPVLSCMGA